MIQQRIDFFKSVAETNDHLWYHGIISYYIVSYSIIS